MTDRAYSLLEVKAIDQSSDSVTVKGIATTPATDRMGDIVESQGAQFRMPMPFLLQHRSSAPIGEVVKATASSKGIEFEARIPLVAEAGTLKERIDEAVQSLKYGLMKAVSIGFRPLKDGVEAILDKDGRWLGDHFKKWEWLELSLVTIPANSQAVITAIKSMDAPHLPATGRDGAPDPQSPGVTGNHQQSADAFTRGAVKLIP